jgi:extradiol dioxygenase family protein
VRDSRDAFHIAVPARDLHEAQAFYVDGLGCKLARHYPDRITLDFFGDQLVCHLSDVAEADPDLYPRHFGVTFYERSHFDSLLQLATNRKLTFFRPCTTRFEGRAEEHLTFVLRDPSSNLIEFKHYFDHRMMY